MKKLFLLFLLLILSGCSEKPLSYDLNHHPLNKSDLKQHWLVLNYFATWCGPCYKEIPALNAFDKMRPKNVLFYAISFDGAAADTLKAFVEKQKIDYPILTSDIGRLYNIQNIQVLPVTFIISPTGKIVQQLNGPQTVQTLIAAIKDNA